MNDQTSILLLACAGGGATPKDATEGQGQRIAVSLGIGIFTNSGISKTPSDWENSQLGIFPILFALFGCFNRRVRRALHPQPRPTMQVSPPSTFGSVAPPPINGDDPDAADQQNAGEQGSDVPDDNGASVPTCNLRDWLPDPLIACQLALAQNANDGAGDSANDAQQTASPASDTAEDATTLVHTSTGVNKQGVRQFGREHKENLSLGDKAELDHYNAVLQAQAKAIKASKDTKQQKINQVITTIGNLQSAIKQDKRNIATDRGDKKKLQADKKELAADQKNLNAAKLDLKKDENIKIATLEPRFNSVASPSKPTQITAEQEQAVNAANGTDADISAVLNKLEGGSYADAYVPWWPDARTDAKGNQVVAVNKSGELQGYLGAGGNGEPNNSGVTVGPGVDLGGQKKDAYFKDLDNTNAKIKILSADELQALKNKISPYMGLTAAKASQYLGKYPLHMNGKELELVTDNAIYTTLDGVKKTYKNIDATGDFSKLTRGQQTILFSLAYQHGASDKIVKAAAAEYAKGKQNYVPPKSREQALNKK